VFDAFYLLLPICFTGGYLLGNYIGKKDGFIQGREYESDEINRALLEAQLEYKERLKQNFSYVEHPMPEEKVR